MFNYFLNCSHRNTMEYCEEIDNNHVLTSMTRKKKNQKLVKRFIKRAVQSLHESEQGERIVKYKDASYSPRDLDKNMILGPPGFYFQHRSSHQRIKKSLEEGELLDKVPAATKKHDFREFGKQKSFKFTSFDTKSRVREALQCMKTNEIPTSWNLNLSLKRKTHEMKEDSSDRKGKNFEMLLPSLNNRIHPKSIETISNSIGIGALKNITLSSKKNSLIVRLQNQYPGSPLVLFKKSNKSKYSSRNNTLNQ